MEVAFDSETHTYCINGDIAKLSVTELLAKHGLAPNYSGVNTKLLKDSADYGTMVHKDLENVANVALDSECVYEPQTLEGESFKCYIDDYITPNTQVYPEKVMGIDYKGLLLGGTADLILINNVDKTTLVADHKTTSTIHKTAVTWQVNILDYMAQFNIPDYQRATNFQVYHYSRDGKMAIMQLEKIPDSEIEKLLDCELNDTIYQPQTLELADNELAIQAEEAEQLLLIKEQEYKQAKANAEKFREQLCKCFEEQHIKSWESPNKTIKITYIEPTTSKTVDTTKLKSEYPEIYEKCCKETTKKGYIKVTTNGNKSEKD